VKKHLSNKGIPTPTPSKTHNFHHRAGGLAIDFAIGLTVDWMRVSPLLAEPQQSYDQHQFNRHSYNAVMTKVETFSALLSAIKGVSMQMRIFAAACVHF
jgi:hypothetical protein